MHEIDQKNFGCDQTKSLENIKGSWGGGGFEKKKPPPPHFSSIPECVGNFATRKAPTFSATIKKVFVVKFKSEKVRIIGSRVYRKIQVFVILCVILFFLGLKILRLEGKKTKFFSQTRKPKCWIWSTRRIFLHVCSKTMLFDNTRKQSLYQI